MRKKVNVNILLVLFFCVYVCVAVLVRDRTDLMAIITIVFAICESVLLSFKITKKRKKY